MTNKKQPQTKIVNERCFYCNGLKEIPSGLESNGWGTCWKICFMCNGKGYIERKYQKVRKTVWERV